ncbi:MAG TPA: hypothetical protein VFB45_25930 [Pseudolabrys sp.]|nr:hypothetical protein [Pseudolabrys sp.]
MSTIRNAALIAAALAIFTPTLASAGWHYDKVCNCRKPDSEYNTRRIVREKPRVITDTRVVNENKVIRRVRVVQENRLVTHVRPVIRRHIIVHRQNLLYRNIVLHKKPARRKSIISYRG